ncbi:hypothetical protein AB5J62_02200 [Amycolatopsis sp. cg5]|uniref:hypothetical protein n=1 Tax=Amycolatopsis sp. cg5 TaxID=3238802 RepID=UPI0035233974
MKIRLFALLAVTVVAGCSSPPGPPPGKPAPKLPAEAIAYDDLKSTNRTFPFHNNCDGLTPELLGSVGLGEARVVPPGPSGPGFCAIKGSDRMLEELWVQEKPTPNTSEPRYFPIVWRGAGQAQYLKRMIFADRYYATETIDFYGGQPGCYLTVDTGSSSALQFRGILPKETAAGYPELNYTMTGYKVDREGTDKFMADACPIVEKVALAALGGIDPDGGSLASA